MAWYPRCMVRRGVVAAVGLAWLGGCADCRAAPGVQPAPTVEAPVAGAVVRPPPTAKAVRPVPAPVPPVVLPPSPPASPTGEPGRWAFDPAPDGFEPTALLDLRYLNEDEAGMHGFVGVDAAGDFVRGDGEPLRFWAAHSQPMRGGLAEDRIQARWLAKRGVNVVRWHGHLHPKRPGAPLDEVDREERDALWRYVAAMKAEGIYTVISPYWANPVKVQPGWDLDSPNMNGLLFFHPEVQAAYRAWWRAILEPDNPHTGVPLKDEPAVAVLQTQNEDSLLFWTMQQITGRERRLLEERFADMARREYGSLEQALAAWHGTTLEGDDPAAGRLALAPLWDLTSNASHRWDLLGGKRARLAFQTRFLAETMREFNASVQHYLRQELGARQLFNAGNWRTADNRVLQDVERYAYLPGEVIALNRYANGGEHLGKNKGWAVMDGDRFEDQSLLFDPMALPLAVKQVQGRAMLLTETLWVPPMSHQSEGPFLASAYGSLTGVDGAFWFQHGSPQFSPTTIPDLGFLLKFTAATPEIAGNYPANALIARNGYVRRGAAVVLERRALDDLFARVPPVVAEQGGYDPNRDSGDGPAASESADQAVDPLAFLVGPVLTRYGDAPSAAEVAPLKKHVDRAARVVRSNTGELVWDYGAGLCTLNAPRAQGATGFIGKRKRVELGDITLRCDNDYATVQVVSLDTQPLARSRHVLVQTGTRARPTGWKTRPERWQDDQGQPHTGEQVLDVGRGPWQVERLHATLEIHNPHLTRAVALDMNGMPTRELPVQREGEALRVELPEDAKYVVLR